MNGEAPPGADRVCEGGDLDCGSGLLLIIREHLSALGPRGVLEVRSREVSVKEDLPAWCRLVGHTLLAVLPGEGPSLSYFIKKESADMSLPADLEKARSFAWTARVRWTGGMQARVYVRNHSFTVGQPASFDTGDTAPSAVEHLLASLGGCLAVGFQWRASQRGLAVRDLEVTLKAGSENILVFLGLSGEGHPGLKEIEALLYLDADGEEEDLQELWEETLERSPVAQSLLRGVPLKAQMRRV